jgi:hypothetical protein
LTGYGGGGISAIAEVSCNQHPEEEISMTQEQSPISQEQLQRVLDKLQPFYEALPEDEKPVLAALLRPREAGDDTVGFYINPYRVQITKEEWERRYITGTFDKR